MFWPDSTLISLEALICLMPVAFFIHDGEEIATVEKYYRTNKRAPLMALGRSLIQLDKRITIQFAAAVLLIGSFLTLITYLTIRDYDSGSQLNMLFVGIVAVILLDGVKHVGVSAASGKYTPGVITAAVVEIPYAAYTLYRLFDAAAADVQTMMAGLGLALPLVVFLVWFGLSLGRVVAPRRSK